MASIKLQMLMQEVVSAVEASHVYTVWSLMMMIITMMIGMVLPNMTIVVPALILTLVRTSPL